MEICIHIGFPKTGTSAIQAHINSNKNWLAKRGVYLPKSGYCSGLGHCFLFGASDANEPPKEIAWLLGDTSAIANLAEEIQACEKAGFDRVLLSWESFSALDRPLISKLKSCFGNHNVTLYAYVREQAELTQSLILQGIKSGRARGTVFSSIANESLTSPWYLDFFSVFSMWEEEFGEDITIRTKIYQRGSLVESDIVADFFDWLGLKIDRHFARQGADVNHSLDFRAAAFLALAKTTGLNSRGMSKLTRALLKSQILGSDRQERFLPKQTVENIQNSHIVSNGRFLERYQPENLTSTQSFDYFSRGSIELPGSEDPLIQISSELYSIISNRQLETWHGNPLTGHELSRVANDTGVGWRKSEEGGIWSLGDLSEIAFQLPAVDPGEGPTGIAVTLRGKYFANNKSTVVSRGEITTREDLQHAVLNIPIDDDVRREGICLKLSHDHPVSPLEMASGKSSDRLAFRLRHLEYDFYWGAAHP